MRIGLFGGSFDPVHAGHFFVAEEIRRICSLDKIYFLPCRQSPLKEQFPCASDAQRLALLTLSLQNTPWAVVDERDLNLPAPSWSWRLVETFREEFPAAELFWIMGTDQWEDLERWARWEYLSSMVTFVVYHRGWAPQSRVGIRSIFLEGEHSASATLVRASVESAYKKGWITTPQWHYINQVGLYRGQTGRRGGEFFPENPFNAEILATLLFIQREGKVLLIKKKRGIGAGKINGPGGKIERGETPLEAICREAEEELCIRVQAPEERGRLYFHFACGTIPSIYCYVFVAKSFEGVEQETEEAIPLWIDEDKIPYEEMWEDDQYWLPQLLAGQCIQAEFSFDHDVMLSQQIEFLTILPSRTEAL